MGSSLEGDEEEEDDDSGSAALRFRLFLLFFCFAGGSEALCAKENDREGIQMGPKESPFPTAMCTE